MAFRCRSTFGSLCAASALALSAAACGVMSPQPYRALAPNLPIQDREQAVQIVVAALTERGYAPSLINERVGTVSTEWRLTAGWMKVFLGYSGQDRLAITVTDSALVLSGEYQMRKGVSLLTAVFHDEERNRHHEADTDWFPADPPGALRQEWERLRVSIAAQISASATTQPTTVSHAAAVGRTNAGGTTGDLPVLHRQPAEPRIAVAVVEFKGIGVSRDEVIILTDRLRAELVDTGIFKVVERERMEELLREQELQLSGACDSDACVVEIGRLVGVGRIITGTIGKLGNTYTTTARLIDVETGEIVARASVDCLCEVEQLLDSMERVAIVLANGAS